MEIKIARQKDYREFIDFQRKLLRGDSNYRDLQSRTVRALLFGKAAILKGAWISPLMIMEGEELLGVCILGIVDRMKDTLQIAFLDFRNDERIIGCLIDYCRKLAKEKGVSNLLIGLNLHVNYGLGLLASSYDKPQSLGSAYNPAYYIEHIGKHIAPSEELVSYRNRIDALDLSVSPRFRAYLDRNFEVRKADFKEIRRTAQIYNIVNNAAFVDHKYYYPRRLDEDIELFREFRPLLNEENLLFVYHKEEPVGFLLWYPDFNQYVAAGKGIGLSTVLQYRLGFSKADTVKFTEIGVLPKYRNRGAVYPLLEACYQMTKGRYTYVETGWIMRGNSGSEGIGARFIQNEYKRYQVFEMKLR